MKSKKRHKAITELNITNLVDVVFNLLIIFMITAPMMTQGVQVDLPEADAENVETNQYIQISINEKSEVFINDERIPLPDFPRRFKNIFAGRTTVPVFVNADKKVPYGLFIKIISDIQNNGVLKLGFLTTPTSQKR